jgi:hypothetical protein
MGYINLHYGESIKGIEAEEYNVVVDAARGIFNLGSQSFILKTAGNEVPDQACLTTLLQRVREISKDKSEKRALDLTVTLC